MLLIALLLIVSLLCPCSAVALPPNSTTLQAVSITAITGEKPQSKVWTHAGAWWCVLPNATGTWLKRLDGTAWTDVLKLSNSTVSKADVKSVGGVAHVLLFEGTASELVSVEYVPATNSYQPWSSRPTAAPVSLDSGVEIATIDIDSQGRMWLAADGATTVTVRHSDPPYSSFGAPFTLASGISTDDIAAVTAFPNGKIGVLWSNQTTQRFGFRTHLDGADPTVWSADELPASQSALNVGAGMADDHLNLAVAADGTLYAAVKTSYDTAGYPKIALLVRRPAGTWDNLYEVDQSGTRGIVLLNEQAGTVSVIYTAAEGFNPIVYKETSIGTIAFGPRTTLIGTSLNDCSSTKQNITNAVVILASTASSAIGVLRSAPSSGPPTITSGSPLPNGVVGSPYGTTLAADDGIAPYFWAITQGTLPAGLSLDSGTGLISGTPVAAETRTFTVRVTDAVSLTDENAFDLTIASTTHVGPGEGLAVEGLAPARPNPLREASTLEFRLVRGGRVDLGIFGLDGRRLRTLVRAVALPGVYRATWDGRDDGGVRVAAGVFFARLETGVGHYKRAITVLN